METFKELLAQSAELYGSGLAFTLKNKQGEYNDISYIRYNEEVRSLATALLAKGYAGQRIAIIGKNSYSWFMANAASLVAGCISVPLDKDLKYGEFELSLVRSEATVIFYDTKEAKMVDEAIASGKTSIRDAYAMYDSEDRPTFQALLEEGKRLIGEGDTSVDQVEIDPDALSILLFTSGTTSLSKIVMLSQRNVISNIRDLMTAEKFYTSDTNIALLPYHHTFGATGQWLMLADGVRTVYCDGLKHLQKNMKEYGVSVFIGVPLIVEQMYKKIMKTAEKEGMDGRLKRFSKVVRVLNKAKIDIRRQVFHGVLDAFGGKLRMVVLGASAADPVCMQGFSDFGILCLQGYGLTETSPVLAAERPNVRKMGSVGIPMDGVELMIFDPDENGIGEVVARGANVMLGYYNDPEATAAVMKDDWFHTGDLGYIDRDGYLFLTGRKKNVIVLKNGKNVFPEELEKEITELPYQLENIVVGLPKNGDEKDLVVSLKIVYDPKFFGEQTAAEIEAKINADVEKLNATLPAYKRIKRTFITDEPMIKTSTSKVKRFLEIEKMLEQEKAEAKDAEAADGAAESEN